jgi:hypothetical protein
VVGDAQATGDTLCSVQERVGAGCCGVVARVVCAMHF